jgi:hypothetical protein
MMNDPEGAVLILGAGHLNAKVFCTVDPLTGGFRWRAQYRSAVSGMISGQGPFNPPLSPFWAEVEDLVFSCPGCDDVANESFLGSFRFTALMGCETSGGIVFYAATVEGLVTLGCP